MCMRFSRASLSNHANERLVERFRISSEQFIELLNAGHGKKIGATGQTHLIHRLIWSQIDEQLLVAIQDVIDGTVLTVLTLEMYRTNYDKNITEKRVQKVVNMMVHAGFAPSSLWKPNAVDEYVTVYADLLGIRNPIALGRWRGEVSSACLRNLGEKPEFWAWVAGQISARGAQVDCVVSVKAKFSGGDLQDIPYAC